MLRQNTAAASGILTVMFLIFKQFGVEYFNQNRDSYLLPLSLWEVRRKQAKVRWVSGEIASRKRVAKDGWAGLPAEQERAAMKFTPPNGRTESLCAPAGTKGKGEDGHPEPSSPLAPSPARKRRGEPLRAPRAFFNSELGTQIGFDVART